MNAKIDNAKARGWVAVIAGAFLAVMMAVIALNLAAGLINGHTRVDANGATVGMIFLGLAFCIAVGGVLIANGIYLISTGRRNMSITITGVVLVFLALGAIVSAVAIRSL